MKTQKVSALITVLLLVTTTLNGIRSAEARSSKLPCRIEISIAHISKDIWIKTGKRAVKVDAFSRCQSPQSKVTLTVELWKTGEFLSHFERGFFSRQNGNYSLRYKIKDDRFVWHALPTSATENSYSGEAPIPESRAEQIEQLIEFFAHSEAGFIS